ncbi:alpha/beta fold hydrolase [Nonomuraea gerenzanensis]|uniref:3-oxoadipate enol-lactone hydrolase/4-carboxymuconolactone decarboxylase n=1 Tax=Nonomuraea gerenzanensis TaxID=93944 RepID=A0A1M4ER13_9ACTN|nr:alpha/beta hydrolase [Nonomuraea gerenzanensis]UBU12731.1 alpha/beta hydrolase [Nonomuraea gerenzanensis]SBP01286.1 3-oxoadipate enol-lactone hydrolase/4-carboxymuconolactone decarboxylase [Nonomuraea gerenzanensis]
MPTVIHGGGAVHYGKAGSGPGLVLVHGTGGDAVTNYAHLVPGFADLRTVITPDYAGSGRTFDPGGDLTLDLLAGQVAAAFEEPSDLVGFSLGAVVAAKLAAERPELVRRLVLIAGWTHLADSRLELGLRTWARLAATDPESFAAYGPLVGFSPGFVGSVGAGALMAGQAPPGTLRQIELDLRVDIRDLLPRITAPTLVIGNTQDYLVPVEHARAMHAAVPGSEYAELDSGHVVLHERPAEVTALIREFITRS